jgi:hypothetical protein
MSDDEIGMILILIMLGAVVLITLLSFSGGW